MPLLTDEELKEFPEPCSKDVVTGYVRRYPDLVAMADKAAVKVIGEGGSIRDKPGFEVDFISNRSAGGEPHSHERASVLMPVKGHWRVQWDDGSVVLAPGDTMSVPESLVHSAVPSMSGEAALYHIIATGDPAGSTWAHR